jgi:hypothetical protein
MSCDVGANTRLIEGVHGSITPIKHAIQLQDVAVGIGAAELVPGALQHCQQQSRTS